jgi:aspartyl protease family protein
VLRNVLVLACLAIVAAVAAPSLMRVAPQTVALRPSAAKPAADVGRGSVILNADRDGHFRVEATIAGRRVPMMVDTGATVVAMSYEQAETLGLVRSGDRFDVPVSTANGTSAAKRVVLRDVRVGSIVVRDVTALVMRPGVMDGNLLGMSFLGRLKRMESSRGRLTLEY